MAELCLGTAQLGMHYGINNTVGKLNQDSVYDILDVAFNSGINVLDTASIYGEAEKIIGNYFDIKKETAKGVKIITKQCDELKSGDIEGSIRKELEKSLRLLKRTEIDGYLLHTYREVDNKETLNVLEKLKEEKIVFKIGVSVYDIDEANIAMETGNIDYIQMPCSIFDQRGLISGVFKKAKERGITIFTRSAFLQGLLMMETENIPNYLADIVPYLKKFNELLNNYSIEKEHAIIKFILSNPYIDYMVFGIECKEQLKKIVSEVESRNLPEEFVDDIKKEFGNISEELILPINWKK